MKEFVAIDFETANPQRVSACSLGIASVSNGIVVKTEHFLIKPVGGHADFQSKIHGIKDEHTRDMPAFNDIYVKIKGIFEFPLVGHSLFDKQVLHALSDHFGLNLSFSYADSSALAKAKLPNIKNWKLPTLVKHFGFPAFKHHDAKEDATACANIFLKLHALDKTQSSTVKTDPYSEFRGLIQGVLADDELNYKEAYQLLYWLDEHSEVASRYRHLHISLKDILSDQALDISECEDLKELLKNTIEG